MVLEFQRGLVMKAGRVQITALCHANVITNYMNGAGHWNIHAEKGRSAGQRRHMRKRMPGRFAVAETPFIKGYSFQKMDFCRLNFTL